MSSGFYDCEDFENRLDVELDEDEQGGLVIVPGQLIFHDLYTPSNGGNDEYDERYGVTFRLPKGNEHVAKLFAVVDRIGEKTWKKEADDKLAAVWDCVDKGVAPRNSNVNIQDGDLFQPEYNKGTYQIKASRRVDEGAPTIVLQNDETLDWDPTDKDSVKEAAEAGPRKGDFCFFQLRVWCQKKRDRINFSLEGVQLAERGSLRVMQADRKQIASKFAKVKSLSMGAFTRQLPSGDDEPEVAAAPKKASKPAAKSAAPAKPAKKGVFRR